MSHWLTNVNNLLTKLDDQVETVVEERAFAQSNSSVDGAVGTGIDDILAKRGLSSSNSKDKINEEVGEANSGSIALLEENETGKTENEVSADLEIDHRASGINKSVHDDLKGDNSKDLGTESSILQPKQLEETVASETKTLSAVSQDLISNKKEATAGEAEGKSTQINDSSGPSTHSNSTTLEDEPVLSATPSPKVANVSNSLFPAPSGSTTSSIKKEQRRSQRTNSPDRPRNEIRELAMERKEAQKEARTLRRHIVSLNDQLEAAESELQAQRKELERAAERMEKDRGRHKDEKEVAKKQKDLEITQLKTEHAKSIEAQQSRFEEQLDRYRKKLSEEEQRRKQEGGDWNKEMSSAIDREHEVRQTLTVLEDEKSVLLTQISTLQNQQAALGSRLESLSQAADNAMERERDAEKRLDVALNQHARQISHRQARELQLERTIQDLNSALVQSRGDGQPLSSQNFDNDGSSKDSLRENSHLEARIIALQSDLETANSHLAIEKERFNRQSETLQIQLQSFSNESTHEANLTYAKEIEYDRQMAEMSTTIASLEAKLKLYEKAQTLIEQADSVHEEQTSNQVKLLSEEVVRLRDKIANHTSESLAMKSRLKAAVEKTNRLEEELQTTKSSQNSDIMTSELLRGSKNTMKGRRRHVGNSNGASMRSAILLTSSHGERTEKIGQVVDQIDSFAASTGKYLRRNPFARAGFIFYLVMIHLWTFVLLFFHAHSFDTGVGNELGTVGYPHGPHAVLQQHLNNIREPELSLEKNNTRAQNLRSGRSFQP